jgi:hypothetical protein
MPRNDPQNCTHEIATRDVCMLCGAALYHGEPLGRVVSEDNLPYVLVVCLN